MEEKEPSLKIKVSFFILLAPVLIFAPTNLNLSGFNLTNCDAFGFEGLLFKFYYILIGIIGMVWIAFLLFTHYRNAKTDFKKQILLMGVGMESFLFFFFTITFLASYLAGIGFFKDSRMEMYGLFGMAVFMVFIAILMTKFKTFSVGLIASNGLVIALIVLISSQYTFISSKVGITLTSITLVLTSLTGIVLIRSEKRSLQRKAN
ncbi:MAG: hypothetical protein R3B53_04105 [Candidatus Paceibacterota bacterium]